LTAVRVMEATFWTPLTARQTGRVHANRRAASPGRPDGRGRTGRRNAQKNRPWLNGIPIAIKDLSDAKGVARQQRIALFCDTIAQRTVCFVQPYSVLAGAIIIGKTTRPNSDLGSHTF